MSRGLVGILEDYRPLRVTYSGHGRLTVAGRSWNAPYRIAQAGDGRCFLACSLPGHLSFDGRQQLAFEGRMSEGTVEAQDDRAASVQEDLTFSERGIRTRVLFRIQSFDVRVSSAVPGSERFAIVNVDISGPDTWELQLDWHGEPIWLTFQAEPDEHRLLRQARLGRSVAVTGQVLVPRNEHYSTEDVVDALCWVLSLGQGRKVQWISRQLVGPDGLACVHEYRNRATRRFGPLSPIDSDWRDTQRFVESVYPVFLARQDEWQIGRLIDAYVDAKSDQDFLESRGIKLAAVLEMIKAQYLEVNDPLQGAILPATQFDALRQDLVNAIEGVATRYSVARTCRSAMRRKAGELNRHPFRDVMQSMCRHLDMALQGDELRQIAAIRNSLIHEGRFSSAASQGPRLEPVEAWRILVSFVDRVLLRLVDYRGPYRDFRSESIQTL